MHTKSEVSSIFQLFHKWIQNQFGTTIKTLRTDGGGEYISNSLTSYTQSCGIQHQISCPYTPEQNGVSKRKHCHLLETTRSLLLPTNLPQNFWLDALLTANYLINLLPSKSLHDKCPYTLLHQKQPSYTHLRVFGSSCFPWQRLQAPNKFSSRAPSCISLGYPTQYKGYHCLNIETEKLIISRHVVFNEDNFPSLSPTLLSRLSPPVTSPHFCPSPPTLPSPPSSTTMPIPPQSSKPTINAPILTPPTPNFHSVITPISPIPAAITPDMAKPYDQLTYYRQLVGLLQYLTLTRPDIAYVVNQVSQQMHSPTFASFQALKRIFRYLQGTPSLGIPIKAAPLHLSAYADSDWANDDSTRRSTTGYCLFLVSNLIAWRVHKQPTIARSTAEAEYRALATAVTYIIWFRRLLSEFKAPQINPTTLYCDNTSALALATNPIFHTRTKHIEIDLHFVRDHISNGTIQVNHISTQDQPANLLTKHHSSRRFQLLRAKLTIQPPDDQFERGRGTSGPPYHNRKE